MPTTDLRVEFADSSFEVRPGQRFRIGRGADSDLSVQGPDISRRHVVLYYEDGWWVADEGSANGTWVDGIRIESATPLRVASELRLGAPDADAVRVDPGTGPAAVPAAGPELGTVLKGGAPQPFRDAPTPQPLAQGSVAITLGKAPDNDIVVDDINVSRHHARVVVANGGFLVEDLNSLNGTLLNAVPVQRGFMSDSDVLTIGNSDFVRRGDRLVPAADERPDDRGLRVSGLELTLRDGKRLIGGVDLVAGRGTLTGVIGPSGAGKSTLAGLLAGITAPTAGRVEFDGFDLQRDYQAVKTRVGLVPQDDVVHRQLQLRRALRYAADLRLPSRLPASAKSDQVDKTIGQLGLEHHVDTRIERLSGGQRKRASVAMELLTEPSLLILDEPTSGLDPALDRQVMRTLRDLADGGRTVMVITHSVAYLDICDQVLVLAPGGLPSFLGPSTGVGKQFRTTDWADIFADLADDPAGSHQRWLAASRTSTPTSSTPTAVSRKAPPGAGWLRQWTTIVARQVAVMLSDRGYLAFLLALPVILGLLPWVVPGNAGLNAVPQNKPDDAGEPTMILVLLILGATFMGVAMSIRDLIGERPIFLRERSVGLFPSAYLLAKLAVFGIFSALLAAILIGASLLVKAPPTHHVLSALPPVLELYLAVALTTWASAALGLLISALATSNDQVMPVLILVLMVQLVLHGGLIPVLDRQVADVHVLDLVSRIVPARWGYAAAASGVDLQSLLEPGRPVGAPAAKKDPLWAHTAAQWLRDMGLLAMFALVFAALANIRLRRVRR